MEDPNKDTEKRELCSLIQRLTSSFSCVCSSSRKGVPLPERSFLLFNLGELIWERKVRNGYSWLPRRTLYTNVSSRGVIQCPSTSPISLSLSVKISSTLDIKANNLNSKEKQHAEVGRIHTHAITHHASNPHHTLLSLLSLLKDINLTDRPRRLRKSSIQIHRPIDQFNASYSTSFMSIPRRGIVTNLGLDSVFYIHGTRHHLAMRSG